MMSDFPIVCIENFYDDPKEIVNILNSFGEYSLSPKDENYTFPGKRSCHIDSKNSNLFDIFSKKFLSTFYNLQEEYVSWNIDSYFQIIEPYDDVRLNEGWIHTDSNHVMSGIIFLNEESDENAGTSLYERNDNVSNKIYDPMHVLETKKNLFLGKETNSEEYIKMRNLHNSQYTETVKFGSKYNRLISFDGKIPHKANNFSVLGKTRITQTFFISGIQANNTPKLKRNLYKY